MSQSPLPALTSTTTLRGLIDHHHDNNADATWALYPNSTAPDGVDHITYFEFARATQRFARIASSLSQTDDVVGLIAVTDTILYLAAVAGFAYAGITVFPISPRNSAAAVIHMLRQVSAHRLMVTSPYLQPLVNGIKEELTSANDNYNVDFDELPTLPEIFPYLANESANHPFTPFQLTAKEFNPSHVVAYIHSSGSTGFPKPIPWTAAIFADQRHSPVHTEIENEPGSLLVGTMSLPTFHTIGMYFQLCYPLFAGRPIAVFAPQYPNAPITPAPDVTLEALHLTKPDAVFVVPTFLEFWSQEPQAIELLKNMRMVGFGGGPLATGVGDLLAAQGVQLAAAYGGTEFGVPTAVWPSGDKRPEDWAWMKMSKRAHPRWANMGDGQFELQLLAADTHVVSVENLSDTRGYATSDLFVKHPTEDLWRIVGRVDDVLILANGEKTVPGPMENVITSSAVVRGAVMFGRQRNQVGLLVEPSWEHMIDPKDEDSLAQFRNEIWPAVEEANKDAPAFSRIFKEMIIVTDPDRPLPRAPKGTVRRKAALADYEQEIEALYEKVESSGQSNDVLHPVEWTIPELTRWLGNICETLREGPAPDPEIDLFQQGFDSLSATFLRNCVTTVLRSSAESTVKAAAHRIQNGFVYANPTLSQLAAAIVSLVSSDGDTSAPSAVEAMQNMIEKYSTNMPSIAPDALYAPKSEYSVVLITGSTGGLGAQVLAGCLASDNVQKVYALNRPSARYSSEERHQITFRDRSLNVELLSSSKLVYLEGDADKHFLGLAPDVYEEVRSVATVIIHNAWRLDFNLSLSSFESNIRGTRNLIDLALTSTQAYHTRVLFTSSIAVTIGWPREKGPFPEEPISDPSFSVGQGYGESKYVGERLLIKAAEIGLQTTSFRIGQVSGSNANGAWATTDWVPTLVKSSIALGCIPDAKGVTSWLPFDPVCQAILDVAFASEKPERSLNLVHPRPVPWTIIANHLADVLAKDGADGRRLPLVPFSEWTQKLQARAAQSSQDDLSAVPAIKLMDFFSGQADADDAIRQNRTNNTEAAGLTTLSTVKSQKASRAMRELAPLGRDDVARWVSYWKAKKFIA